MYRSRETLASRKLREARQAKAARPRSTPLAPCCESNTCESAGFGQPCKTIEECTHQRSMHHQSEDSLCPITSSDRTNSPDFSFDTRRAPVQAGHSVSPARRSLSTVQACRKSCPSLLSRGCAAARSSRTRKGRPETTAAAIPPSGFVRTCVYGRIGFPLGMYVVRLCLPVFFVCTSVHG